MQFIKVQQYRRQIRIFAYSYLYILNKKSTFLKPCLPIRVDRFLVFLEFA
jgi:hypothetical protein